MSIDLIGLVQDALTPEAIDKLSSTLGESATGTRKALESGVPAILTGMVGKTSTGEGIASLLSLFRSAGTDGGILNNFGLLVNDSAGPALLDLGNGIVRVVLGDNAIDVADAISSQSGVRPESAASLLGMAAPLAVGAISKVNGQEGVTVATLLRTLSSQAESFARYLPAGLGGVLGGAALAAVRSPMPASESVASPRSLEAGGLKRFWPLWIVLAALMLGGLFWSFNQETSPLASATDASVGSAVPVATTPSYSALGVFSKRTLPNGTELNIPQLGIENKLVDFIESSHVVDKETWFDFDRLLFDTGSVTLQPSSSEQLDNVAAILKAYPKVAVRIGGYTDNVGDRAGNLQLSKQRAETVVSALVKTGVDPARLSAQGYGEIHSVADNATEEGRARNRRIALRVTRK